MELSGVACKEDIHGIKWKMVAQYNGLIEVRLLQHEIAV